MRKAVAILMALAMLAVATVLVAVAIGFIDLFNGGVHLMVILNSNN